MKRWVAGLLLVVVATFLAASGSDRCRGASEGQHHRPQHILCLDDCAPALVPAAPAVPAPDAPFPVLYAAASIRFLLIRNLEPEKDPPRV